MDNQVGPTGPDANEANVVPEDANGGGPPASSPGEVPSQELDRRDRVQELLARSSQLTPEFDLLDIAASTAELMERLDAVRSPRRTSAGCCRTWPPRPGSPSACTRTACGTPTRPNCGRRAWTSGSSRSNWGIGRSRPPRGIWNTSRRWRCLRRCEGGSGSRVHSVGPRPAMSVGAGDSRDRQD